MKTFRTTFAILLISILAFSSCKKKKDETPAPIPATNYFLKAKIDGVVYNADGIRVTASRTADRLTIGSVLPDNRNFEIILNNTMSLRSYLTNNEFDGLRMAFSDGTLATAVFNTSRCDGRGTLTINALSTTEVAGTFSFTGKRTGGCTLVGKVITEGEFKCGIIQ